MLKFISVRQAPRAAHARSAAPWFAASIIGATCAGAMAQTSLAPVTVTATRFAAVAADLPFGVSVLTADDIKASGATTVNDAIMRLLGVPGRLDLNGGGDYGLDLRGLSSTKSYLQAIGLRAFAAAPNPEL